MRARTILALFLSASMCTQAQHFESYTEGRTVVTNSFWSDCFVQAGLDMTLQNPYGYSFRDVFPNGKSFGMEVAVGKWFAPAIGLRGKFNWENALPLLKNDKANWLAPFYHPGVNRDRGGYVAAYGDVLLNVHGLLLPYRDERAWELSVYPRVGLNYNFGVSKGSLAVGIGVLNTYRLSPRWSLYADVAYMMSGSGFVGSENIKPTGTGSNSNGYLTVGIGAQFNVTRSHTTERSVETRSFWNNWFAQLAPDMTLMNPYGHNFFGHALSRGRTHGITAGLGKWFTPEIALRGRVQWDNGLIENSRLQWVPPVDDPSQNFDGHGFIVLSLDALLNLTNIFAGYQPDKLWHTSVYGRAGLMRHFKIGSYSPVLGIGVEQSYRLSDRWSLYGSAGYQVTTSEGSYGLTGMSVSTGSNGFFDFELGVSVDIGQRTWQHKK